MRETLKKSILVSVTSMKKPADLEAQQAEQLYRAERALREIENRVSDASLQVPGWKPPHEPFDEAEDGLYNPRRFYLSVYHTFPLVSNDSWTGHAHLLNSIHPTPSLNDLQNRLLALEANIERRYLRQNFYAG